MDTSKGIKVRLGWDDVLTAAQGGVMRNVRGMKEGRKHIVGYRGGLAFENHIIGACGELAAAIALGLTWRPGVNVFKGPDIGALQIRTTAMERLIVRPGDGDDERFVMVYYTLESFPVFWVMGWAWGSEAKQEGLSRRAGRPRTLFL